MTIAIIYAATGLVMFTFDRWVTAGMTPEFRDWPTSLLIAATWPLVGLLFLFSPSMAR